MDFMRCPMLYRFRVVDRLPEPISAPQARGTLVHAVLERLFDAPASERTRALAGQLLEPEWNRLVDQRPDLAALVAPPDAKRSPDDPVSRAAEISPDGTAASSANGSPDDAAASSGEMSSERTAAAAADGSPGDAARSGSDTSHEGTAAPGADHSPDDGATPGGETSSEGTAAANVDDFPADAALSGADTSAEDAAASLRAWFDDAQALIDRWFTLEDPTRLEPAEREFYVEADVDGLKLRGYVDRLDRSDAGLLRIVDYKTGRSPAEPFEVKAMFQLKFYALVLWRLTGQVPARLQLVYLGDGEVLTYDPDADDLRFVERKIAALWQAVVVAAETGDYVPNRGRHCTFCDHRAVCPAWGGTPPPLPDDATERALDPRPREAAAP